MVGIDQWICIGFGAASSSLLVWQTFALNARSGEHGLMKLGAARSLSLIHISAQEVPAAAPTEEDTAAPEPSPVQPGTREKAQRESGRRKRQDEDYNELFLRRNEIKTRQCVYISRDVHGRSSES